MELYLVTLGPASTAYSSMHWRELAKLDPDGLFVNMFSDTNRYFVISRGVRLIRRTNDT